MTAFKRIHDLAGARRFLDRLHASMQVVPLAGLTCVIAVHDARRLLDRARPRAASDVITLPVRQFPYTAAESRELDDRGLSGTVRGQLYAHIEGPQDRMADGLARPRPSNRATHTAVPGERALQRLPSGLAGLETGAAPHPAARIGRTAPRPAGVP